MFIREDQAEIVVTIDGTPYNGAAGSWHSIEGGDLEGQDGKARAGGMGNEVALGGPASRNDATVSIPLDDVVVGWHKTFEQKIIEAAPVNVTIKYLDRKKAELTGSAHTITGVLKAAKLPNVDSGASEAGMYQIVISCDEVHA